MSTLAYLVAKLIGLALSVAAGAIGLLAAMNRYKTSKKHKELLSSELASKFVKQFNEKELLRNLSSYVVPHCSPADPANKEGEEYLAEIREPLFTYIDRTISKAGKSYQLLLADTGMGKTTFCINYLVHARSTFPNLNTALISLSSKGCDAHIKSVPDKSDTILIADAFDEDPSGWENGRERLSQLLEICEDFKAVIITCRSQYFLSDEAIPRETPLPIMVPRSLGQGQIFSLIRSYISPFSSDEIDQYINHQFPRLYFWRWRSRRRARQLIDAVPDLAYRPMLLEKLPDLARQKRISSEIFDLYSTLIEGWLERESRWISEDRLRAISLDLAIRMYSEFRSRRGRLRASEIQQFATDLYGDSPDWNHLTSRSLLNRDSRGFYKFAHKSILEFLVVLAACEGNERATEVAWTDFMRELFVSWGHSASGKDQWQHAQQLLQSSAGRRNIAPLYDPLDALPVKGRPDFERCADRRRTQNGYRIAPATWRASAISIENQGGSGVTTIIDSDYDLTWTYIPPDMHGLGDDQSLLRLVDILNFLDSNPMYKLPSYEQFVSLAEGLNKFGREILPDGRLFPIGDKPGKHEHLLVQLNHEILDRTNLRVIDKQRQIRETTVYLNCYQTGITASASYATQIRVGQLYVNNRSADRFL